MRKGVKLLVILNWALLSAIPVMSQTHFISDAKFYTQVQNDLQVKMKQLPTGNFFSIFKQENLTTYEEEALSFLYAYLPESDIVDKNGEYFLENVRMTQKAIQEMPWGKQLDESLIRYFVLPIRVNNEPLDDFRKTYYEEIKARVKDLSLAEAILAVNHWCHEKVVYTPSDGRTSSPLYPAPGYSSSVRPSSLSSSRRYFAKASCFSVLGHCASFSSLLCVSKLT